MSALTDTELLDAAERYRWDIDAPGEDGSATWVIYDNVQRVEGFEEPLGARL